jgi:acetyltransferase-like isoleucine patch superfamily enzyme
MNKKSQVIYPALCDSDFLEFAWDYLMSSGPYKEVARRIHNRYSENEKRQQLNSIGKIVPYEILEKIFDHTHDWISNNVRIVSAYCAESVDNISFQPRFGWTVRDRNHRKSYLGKLALAETGALNLDIGHRTYFSGDCHLGGQGIASLGSYTAIGEGFRLKMHGGHPVDYPALMNLQREHRLSADDLTLPLEYHFLQVDPKDFRVSIGNDVWIGRNVEMGPNIGIADGCIIGERSLVLEGTKTEPYSVYAGIPAKRLRFRFSEPVISQLLDLKWWDWPIEKMRKNQEFFESNLAKVDHIPPELIR